MEDEYRYVIDAAIAADSEAVAAEIESDDPASSVDTISGTDSTSAETVGAVDSASVAVVIMAADAGTTDDAMGNDYELSGVTDSAIATDGASTHGVPFPESLPTGDPIPNNVFLARNGLDGGTVITYQDKYVTVSSSINGQLVSSNTSNLLGVSTAIDSVGSEGYGRALWDMRPTGTPKFVLKGKGSARFETFYAGDGDEIYCEWAESTLGIHSEMFLRFYLRTQSFSLPETGDFILAEWFDTVTGVANRISLNAGANVTMRTYDANGAILGTTGDASYALAANTWYRFEARIRLSATPGDGTTGALSAFHLFAGDGHTILTGAEEWYPNSTSGECNRFRFGLFRVPGAPAFNDDVTVWFDDLVLSTVDWIGLEAVPKLSHSHAGVTREEAWVTVTGLVAQADSEAVTAIDSAIATVEIADTDVGTFDDPFGEIDFGGVHDVPVYEYALADDAGAFEDA